MTLAAFILAGGRGDRVHGPTPKIELPIAGLACFQHLLNTVQSIESLVPFLIASPNFAKSHAHHAVQECPQGTGQAVRVGCEAWGSTPPENVLVLYADVPLIRKETIAKGLQEHKDKDNTITLLSFNAPLPNTYGRIVESASNPKEVVAIIDAADETRPVFGHTLAHSGIMIIKGQFLWDNIKKIQKHNAQEEYYLTDIVALAAKSGHPVGHTSIVKEDAQGLNTWSDWVILENIFQTRTRSHWFSQNTLIGPYVRLHYDTRLSPGISIESFVTFGPNVSIGESSHIASFCHLSECSIGAHSWIGPFAHIHKNTHVGVRNTIGNFVECVRTTTQEDVKAKHLAYLGDAHLGPEVNVGAGTVFANFDGNNKHVTSVGKGASLGANSTIVSPLTLGDGCLVGAGSTITKDVPENALALERTSMTTEPSGAIRYHKKKKSP